MDGWSGVEYMVSVGIKEMLGRVVVCGRKAGKTAVGNKTRFVRTISSPVRPRDHPFEILESSLASCADTRPVTVVGHENPSPGAVENPSVFFPMGEFLFGGGEEEEWLIRRCSIGNH